MMDNPWLPGGLGDKVNHDYQLSANRPYPIHALEHIDFRGRQPTGDFVLPHRRARPWPSMPAPAGVSVERAQIAYHPDLIGDQETTP